MHAFAFRDLFYTDKRPGVVVRATLTLLPATSSGRRSDQVARWRPNHNFGDPDAREFYIGEVRFDSVERIEPGETRAVVVTFLDGPGLRDKLVPGRAWRVQEGPTLVAEAHVVDVSGET